MKRAALGVLLPLGLLLGALALGGCGRQPRFVPAEADSTAAVPADSLDVYVREAREHWETPGGREDGVRMLARLVLDDLRARGGGALAARARDFVDSLGFGAEVAGRGNLAVVNFFARSDPGAGSWPHLYWREDADVALQALEARGMRLVAVAPEAGGDPPARVAVLFSRTGLLGQLPFVFVWHRPPGRPWTLLQSLGADSLGAPGTAEFVDPGPDGEVLVSRAQMTAPQFNECATCPHIYRTRRFRWGTAGLVSVGEEVERSPYATFVYFIQALSAGDHAGALRQVAEPALLEAARGHGWEREQGLWRIAPGSASHALDLVFFRGAREAYRVQFAPRGEDWVITGFEATTRAIE